MKKIKYSFIKNSLLNYKNIYEQNNYINLISVEIVIKLLLLCLWLIFLINTFGHMGIKFFFKYHSIA